MKSRTPRPLVRGRRVFLRYPALADAEEFITLARGSLGFHRGLVSPAVDSESFTDFLERNGSDANECLLICLEDTGEIVGTINLSQIFYGPFKNAYLGYYLFESFTGEGFMTEALGLVLKYGFRKLKLHRLEANIQPENRASISVVKRCGFTKEGYSRKYLKIGGKWRDHERWAIIKEDWRDLPNSR